MVTPLRGRDELDLPGLERLIEHILKGGVSGLFILGTTGEGPSLSYHLRRELIQRTCRQVQGRVPVLVGITDTAFVESLDLARHAAAAGADALVLAPPYYLPEGQPELQEYLDHLVAQLPLPLFLYNTPKLTKVQYELGALRWAMEQPRVIGLKDSSKSMSYFHDAVGLLKHRPDWSLLIGPEELLADALLAGGHGGVPGGANLFPSSTSSSVRLLARAIFSGLGGFTPRSCRSAIRFTRSGTTLRRSSKASSARCPAWGFATTSWPNRFTGSALRSGHGFNANYRG